MVGSSSCVLSAGQVYLQLVSDRERYKSDESTRMERTLLVGREREIDREI